MYICMKKSSFGLGVQAIIYGDIIGLEWGYNGALYMFLYFTTITIRRKGNDIEAGRRTQKRLV